MQEQFSSAKFCLVKIHRTSVMFDMQSARLTFLTMNRTFASLMTRGDEKRSRGMIHLRMECVTHCIRAMRILRDASLPVQYLIFPFFFTPRSTTLPVPSHRASDHEYEMRHLDTSSSRAWRHSGPLINFWEPALGRYVCTATPTPITDMETTFRSTDANQRPATTENHTPSCNARE